MPDKPILFSGPMVRALLEGRKTQTRRVLKPQPPDKRKINMIGDFLWATPDRSWSWAPMAMNGDRLWVREAHYLTDDGESEYAVFAVDEAGVAEHLQNMQTTMSSHPQIDWSKHVRLRPSIHMPRWASRLTLVVTDVRVQRVQEISGADALAEGIERMKSGRGFYDPQKGHGAVHFGAYFTSETDAFMHLWDSLNAGRGLGWAANPWVAAYTFAVHKCNIDQMEARDQ